MRVRETRLMDGPTAGGINQGACGDFGRIHQGRNGLTLVRPCQSQLSRSSFRNPIRCSDSVDSVGTLPTVHALEDYPLKACGILLFASNQAVSTAAFGNRKVAETRTPNDRSSGSTASSNAAYRPRRSRQTISWSSRRYNRPAAKDGA